MSKLILLVLLILAIAIYCFQKFNFDDNTTRMNNTEIFSNLKQIASTQYIRLQQTGSFANSLKALDFQGLSSDKINRIILSQKSGKEYCGHIFTNIIDVKETDDARFHYGLQATPLNSKAGKSFLLIMDQTKQPFSLDDSQPPKNDQSEDIQYYESTEILPIFKTWPTVLDLSKWKRIKLLNLPVGK